MEVSSAKVSSLPSKRAWTWLLVCVLAVQSLQVYGQEDSGAHSGDAAAHAHGQTPAKELNRKPVNGHGPGSAPAEGEASGEGLLITTTHIPTVTDAPSHFPTEEPTTEHYPDTKMITEEPYAYTSPPESYVAAKEATAMSTRLPYAYHRISPRVEEDLFPVPEVSRDSEVIDFLEELRVSSAPGVQVVPGSQRDFVAYRLGERVQIRQDTRVVHPFGFPREFSFVSTFKMRENTPEQVWNLWEVTDGNGNNQFRVRLYGEINAVDVYNAAADEKVTTFENVGKLFGEGWHKLSLSAKRNQLTLYVDCQQVGTAPISQYGSISTSGVTTIARRTRDDATLPVDLQQLQFYSDPDRAIAETCCEMPGVTAERHF
ncbi:collagen alpha-1(IX) chain [Latimeria chalumnae]|uniref:collagen alpha-1(IX) chain n=1 Tax=Latimeria chalumnae TaxID=7897 RepID=UPI00313DDCA8